MTDITLYTRTTCSECQKAKLILEQNKISYNEIIIDKDITREEVLNQFPTAKLLPVITTDDRAILTGVNGLESYLNEKGLLLL
jgi:glutaredoxin